MDPYLEAPSVWHGLHIKLVVVTVQLLQPQLRQRGYYAESNERVWLAEPQRDVLPDVSVVRMPRRLPRRASKAAVLEADEPVRVRREKVEVHEPYVEIFALAGRRLVTGIEFLSPTNKSQTKGRKLYLRKRKDLKAAGVNLVEIDLLRKGRHLADVPLDVLEPFQPWHYLVNVIRSSAEEYEFYPVSLRAPLPCVGIPLKADEPDAVLDLQAVVSRAYDIGPYPERLDDYLHDPSPKLPPEDAKWARQLLAKAGFRKKAAN
jgi:hypothetical protein